MEIFLDFCFHLKKCMQNSCGMKCFGGFWATEVLEDCRRSMGGHAYSAYSGMPRIISDFAVVTTGGGDNIVIAQQTARLLLKTFQKAIKGKASKEVNSLSYFADFKTILEKKPTSPDTKNWDDSKNIGLFRKCFQYLSLAMMKDAMSKYKIDCQNMEESLAWNESMMDLIDASEAHINLYTLEGNISYLENFEKNGNKEIFILLKQLFFCMHIEQLNKEQLGF